MRKRANAPLPGARSRALSSIAAARTLRWCLNTDDNNSSLPTSPSAQDCVCCCLLPLTGRTHNRLCTKSPDC
jgi:hypothetical protein